MPSLVTSGGTYFSTTTWLQAAFKVARCVNGERDDDVLVQAKDHISDIIKDWNTRRLWKCMLMQYEETPIAIAGRQFPLPSLIKKVYAVTYDDKPLRYLPKRELLRSGLSSVSNVYTSYNSEQSGLIELGFDAEVGHTLKVWYYKKMTDHGSDNDTLDVPMDWEGYILDGARARLLGEKGPTEKLGFWDAKYEQGYLRACGDDEKLPDADFSLKVDSLYVSQYEPDTEFGEE